MSSGSVLTVLGGMTEGVEGEDSANQGPTERDIGDENGGGNFADVPVEEDGTVSDSEIEVAVENCC